MVDLGDLHPGRALGDRRRSHHRLGDVRARSGPSGLRLAGPVRGARRPWHPMGGRPLGGAFARDQAGGEAAADPIPSLPLPANPTRLLGFDRLPRLMHAVDDPVLDRAVRPRPEACAYPLRRRPRQELYRPEPGVRALRLRAGPAGADRVALGKMEARRRLSCIGVGLHRQHAVRGIGADRADLHGGAAGIVRLRVISAGARCSHYWRAPSSPPR